METATERAFGKGLVWARGLERAKGEATAQASAEALAQGMVEWLASVMVRATDPG